MSENRFMFIVSEEVLFVGSFMVVQTQALIFLGFTQIHFFKKQKFLSVLCGIVYSYQVCDFAEDIYHPWFQTKTVRS